MNLSLVEKVLLYSSKLQLNAAELELLNRSLTQIDDWEELANLLVKRGIAPLLYAKRTLLSAYSATPEDFRQQIESAYSRTLMRSMVLYSHLVTEKDKKLFLHYLHGGKLQASHVGTHTQNIANIPSFRAKLRYVWEVVFPGREFMVSKYIESKEQRTKSKDREERQRSKVEDQKTGEVENRGKRQEVRREGENINSSSHQHSR